MNQFHCSKKDSSFEGLLLLDILIPTVSLSLKAIDMSATLGFAGKADSLMDELIAQDKHGKNK